MGRVRNEDGVEPFPVSRIEKLVTTGFSLSRSAVRGMVESGRIRLPMAIGAKARKDFTFFVVAPARRSDGPQPLLSGCEVVIGNAAPSTT